MTHHNQPTTPKALRVCPDVGKLILMHIVFARFCVFLCCWQSYCAIATPDLRIEVTTFGCDCLSTTSFSNDHFDALNVPSANGRFLALTTDAQRLKIAAQGNVLAVYHNSLNDGWTTNTPAESAAKFNQYALNNHTSTGPRPDWIVLNEISSSQWQNSSDYRDWLVEVVRLLRQTYAFNVVVYAPFSNPGNSSTWWTALSSNAYVAAEVYLSGAEIKAQNYSVSWCQGQYQSSLNSYNAVGVPKAKLILGEHFAQTVAGTGWGRSGIASNEWDQAINARSRAALNLGFTGFASYAWVYNGMLAIKEEMIHFEKTYATNALPTVSGLTAPYISLGPQNQKVLAGSTTSLRVYPAGTNLPAFQWKLNGAAIPGATASIYTITNVQAAHGGLYSVALSNSLGIVTSSNALLSVVAVFDPFNYNSGLSLPGQTSPQGSIWNSAGPAGAAVTVTNNSLPIPGATGNRILFGAATGPSARISVSGPVTNGTIYYSFAFKVLDLGQLSSSGGFFAAFNNSTGNQTGTPSVIGAGVQTLAGGNGYQVGLKKASSGSVFDSSQSYTTNDTIFVVGSYTVNTATTNDDVANHWINPDPATCSADAPPTATLTSTSGPDITTNQVASFVFFRRGSATVQPALMVADELRIGPSWASVTPVVPPTAPPTLLVQRSGTDVVLRWETNSTGFVLQKSQTISGDALWEDASTSTGVDQGFFNSTNAISGPMEFFRLYRTE